MKFSEKEIKYVVLEWHGVWMKCTTEWNMFDRNQQRYNFWPDRSTCSHMPFYIVSIHRVNFQHMMPSSSPLIPHSHHPKFLSNHLTYRMFNSRKTFFLWHTLLKRRLCQPIWNNHRMLLNILPWIKVVFHLSF